jgi:hypothetical protein
VTSRSANVVTALGLLGLLAAVSLTAPHWARIFQQPVEPNPEELDPGADRPAHDAAGTEAERTISVKLFFEDPEARGLTLEERAVPFSNDLAAQVRVLVEELIKGSRIGLQPTLPAETKVLAVFVSARGIAYVDLSKEAAAGHEGGSDAELRSVYSVVNSITSSFPSIARVQILLDDQPAVTLAGHVDLSRPLWPDMTQLAAAALEPASSPSPGAPPGTSKSPSS